MTRGQDMNREPVRRVHNREPVCLMDFLFLVPPKLKVCSNSKPADNGLGLRSQRGHCRIVQMVPVVMTDQQIIYFRYILCRVGVGSIKGSVHIWNWRGRSAEHRIDQNAFASELD